MAASGTDQTVSDIAFDMGFRLYVLKSCDSIYTAPMGMSEDKIPVYLAITPVHATVLTAANTWSKPFHSLT